MKIANEYFRLSYADRKLELKLGTEYLNTIPINML